MKSFTSSMENFMIDRLNVAFLPRVGFCRDLVKCICLVQASPYLMRTFLPTVHDDP